MRHLLKTFVVLFIIFLLSGCEKEPDLNLKKDESFSAPFHERITDTYLALFQLISTGIQEAITKPQLYFLAELGDTRDCPDSSVDNTTTYPKVLTLDFVNCNSAGIIYNGMVPITFNAPLGQDADPTDTFEIVVPPVMGITINGYAFELTGPIKLDRVDTGSGFYDYNFILEGAIISSKDGTTTTLPAGSCGTFGLGFTDGDDPNNPIDYVDNPFQVSLKETTVVCASAGASHSFCTMTGNEPLSLNPSTCSCPTQGDLEITTGACGSTGGAASSYDFGFDGRNSDAGMCDPIVNELTIIDFLSWEGVVTADGGVADGLTSIDILVDEEPAAPLGTSLQLTDGGSGAAGHGFFWTGSTNASSGFINVGQTISNTTTPNTPWINEIHYNNEGPRGDIDEGIEIAGPAGLDLSNYCLYLYDGDTNQPSGAEISLRGRTIPDEGRGFGAVFIDIPAIQNGAPDGVAFYRKDNIAVSFCAGR